MKKKVTSHRPLLVKPKVERTLDQKLSADDEALQHQRYLIDGVIKTFAVKKLNYASATRGLLKNNTEKWIRKHDLSTDAAAIGMTRGAFFGKA